MVLRGRALRLHVEAEDRDSLARLRLLLKLTRIRTGLVWAEASGPGPETLSVLYGGESWLRAAAGSADGHRLLVRSEPAAAERMLADAHPELAAAAAIDERTSEVAADLPRFVWEVTQPADGLVMSLKGHDCQPVLDLEVPWAELAAEDFCRALLANRPEGVDAHRLPHLPDGASWGVALSHDIDYLFTTARYRATRLYYLLYVLRSLPGPGKAARAARHFWRQFRAPREWDHIPSLEAELDVGASSDWFVFARRPGNWRGPWAKALNPQYELDDPSLGDLLMRIGAAGHPIGLHASPQSGDDAELLLAECEALQLATGVEPRTVRHHLGRFEWPQSSEGWRAARFDLDSSFILNDVHGYRLGASCVLPIVTGGNRDMIELSASWMDASAYNYEARSPDVIAASLREMVDRARSRSGLESMVWHDIPLYGDHRAGIYRDFLEYAASRGGLLAPFSRFARHSRALLELELLEREGDVVLEGPSEFLAEVEVVQGPEDARVPVGVGTGPNGGRRPGA